jgi:hypothetical protein
MELNQSKSLLAKLMATENLIVEQRNVRTASFDTETRVLTVPILDKNISSYLYDLFLGHEVGHALYTPMEGLLKAKDLKIPRSIINVIEDVRIERKIKTKYPGIRQCFIKGYRELIEKDFFGTDGIDLNELNFIDRVNLYSKGGAAQGIKFPNDEEKALLSKIENAESFDDVINIAIEVAGYMESQAEEQRQKRKVEIQLDEDAEDEFDFESLKSGEVEESDDEDWEGGEIGEDADIADEGAGGFNGSKTADTTSFTDEEFHKNEHKLFSKEYGAYYYGNIPDVDLDRMIIPYKKIWGRYREFCASHYGNYGNESGINRKGFVKLRSDSAKVVGYLAKEFELRKNAEQLKRATTARTGELNMSKLWAYKLTDDIFKKISVVPDGKSHGLVMFIDWSGSMARHIDSTIKQLINLTMFCKKVNIPFEVYAFTSEYRGDKEYGDTHTGTQKPGDIQFSPSNLMNLFSSKMSASEFSYAASAMLRLGNSRWPRPMWFRLGGTPLNETIMAAMKIVPEFQKKFKLQIVNTVFLTDGEGHPSRHVWCELQDSFYAGKPVITARRSNSRDSSEGLNAETFVICDPVTKQQEICDNTFGRKLTSSYIKLLKQRTGCNVIGFYVLSGRELSRVLGDFFPNVANRDSYVTKFRESKSLIVTNDGYDEYYLLRAEGLDIEDKEFEVKENATTRGLVSAFRKYAGNRLNQRVVLNRFIGMIA